MTEYKGDDRRNSSYHSIMIDEEIDLCIRRGHGLFARNIRRYSWTYLCRCYQLRWVRLVKSRCVSDPKAKIIMANRYSSRVKT